MSEVYNFKDLVIHVVDKLLSFEKSVEKCRQLDSKLLNYKSLKTKSVYDKVKQNLSKYGPREYRISSLRNNSVDCYSLFNFRYVNPRYQSDICKDYFEYEQKYFTLCEKKADETVSENESNNIVLIVLVISFIMLAVCAIVLYVFRKKIFARFYHPLVGEDVDRNSNHVGLLKIF